MYKCDISIDKTVILPYTLFMTDTDEFGSYTAAIFYT
jgi:hypothetical protein